MKEIVLASRNRKKIEELKSLLEEMPVRITSLLDYSDIPDIEENGTTFAENAVIKAKTTASVTGQIAIGDDSGLVVDALGGQPGIYSNRFAGPGATDKDKYLRILDLLNGISDEKRTARFRAAVSISIPNGMTEVVEGTCEGVIAHEPVGEGGFGYDPIFFIPELGKSMAELTSEEKNRISHRGKALEAAREIIKEWLMVDG